MEDVEIIDDDKLEKENYESFFVFIWKITTVQTWPLKKCIQRPGLDIDASLLINFIINRKEK